MIFPTILFILYVVITSIIYGIPNSLSQTYLLIHKSRAILFSVIMVIIAFSTLILTLSRVHDIFTVLLTSSGIVGIIFVAIFAQFLDKYQKILHFFGAGLAAISTILWTFIIYENELALFFPILIQSISIPLIYNKRKFIFWIEMGCFINYFLVANLVYYNII